MRYPIIQLAKQTICQYGRERAGFSAENGVQITLGILANRQQDPVLLICW
ncbi:hypothetical protein [Aeromonas veronii]|nr:hypothetical protein [Aeromonas veronii]